MSVFIRAIQGKIFLVNHGKKELSLCIEEVFSGEAKVKKIDFSLDPNVRIVNIDNQPMRLVALKEGQKVEVGYTRDKSKRTALYIAALS